MFWQFSLFLILGIPLLISIFATITDEAAESGADKFRISLTGRKMLECALVTRWLLFWSSAWSIVSPSISGDQRLRPYPGTGVPSARRSPHDCPSTIRITAISHSNSFHRPLRLVWNEVLTRTLLLFSTGRDFPKFLVSRRFQSSTPTSAPN